MTAYSGGEQIQNYLDPNRPDYGGIVLATSESGSALKRALVKLSADVAGAKEMADASEKAAKMGAAGIVDRANAGTFAAGIGALGQVASAGITAYGNLPKKTEFSQPVPGVPGARETIGGYDSYETFDPNKYKIEIPKSIVMDTTGEYY